MTLDDLDRLVAQQTMSGPLLADRIHRALWDAAPALVKIAKAVAGMREFDRDGYCLACCTYKHEHDCEWASALAAANLLDGGGQ